MFRLPQKIKHSFDRGCLLTPTRSPILRFQQGLGSVHSGERGGCLHTPQGAGGFKELRREIYSSLENEVGWQRKQSLD